MQAIIIADHSQCKLAPLSHQLPLPLLPLAGKPLLMHALESLHRAGIHEITVVAPASANQLQREIDTGPLLGMNVCFQHHPANLEDSETHSLVLGLRDMVDASWNDVLDRFGDLKLHARIPIRMIAQGIPIALLLPPGFSGQLPVDWADAHLLDAIQLPIGPLRLISAASLPEYHEANFRVLRGEIKALTPAGRFWTEGHRIGPKARVRPGSLHTHHAFLGAHCRVDRTARLEGQVIVGENAEIARGARVRDSIIMDNTYLGAKTDCTRSILCGDLLIRVDTGISIRLNDPLLFGAIV
jgi:NDP-sugar pyrophosphorylase family protein